MNNEQPTMNDYAKQTQSNPTCSELACPELVEGVEPISKAAPTRLAGCFSREPKEGLEIILYPAPVQNNMYNHQNHKQKGQIKVDTAPFVPAHRPKLFYRLSAAAVVKLAAKSAAAGRQYILHNKAGKSQTHKIKKRNQNNDEIQ